MESLAFQSKIDIAANEQLKEYDDATTEMAEMLDGSMRTVVEFIFDGRELQGRDGRKLHDITDKSIRDARQLVDSSPNLWFELRRRNLEAEEVQMANQMALQPDSFNTMVVVSDFPPELIECPADIGGYNISRQQTYLRVYNRHTNGDVTMYSQSLDYSNRQALEEIFAFLGEPAQPGELLGQRITKNLKADLQTDLIDTLTNIYDQSMAQQFGGHWHAGRRGELRLDTYNFVCRQQDLVNAFIAVQKLQDVNKLYDVAAALQFRFENQKNFPEQNQITTGDIPIEHLQSEIMLAGSQARSEGKSFSACGITLLASGKDVSTDESLQTAGMGNQTNEETKYNFDKKMYCVVCQAPPKKDETKKMCGPCGICRACDAKLKKKSP